VSSDTVAKNAKMTATVDRC